MKISVSVAGVPPKKDGSQSLWGKTLEIPRLQALRLAVAAAMPKPIPPSTNITLRLRVFANPGQGDLDNFLTGICDGLMAAHSRFPKQDLWVGCPERVLPNVVVGFEDDKYVSRIEAQRLPIDERGACYELELEWAAEV